MTTNQIQPRERLIIALDVGSAKEAVALVRELSDHVTFFKIGLQLFTSAGPEVVRAVRETGAKVFLDLKLHDIPNTVAKAVSAASELGVSMLTLHLSGGRNMLEAAAAACPPDLLLLGVTVLTSADDATLREIGVEADVAKQALRLAAIGAAAGVRGLITSPREVAVLRKTLGSNATIITPGVRPSWAAADDQKRFTTPAEALQNGADYLVIGRPVTAHRDPREAVRMILSEITR
jgi:orotidine-5'-phosphate decarboxylase